MSSLTAISRMVIDDDHFWMAGTSRSSLSTKSRSIAALSIDEYLSKAFLSEIFRFPDEISPPLKALDSHKSLLLISTTVGIIFITPFHSPEVLNFSQLANFTNFLQVLQASVSTWYYQDTGSDTKHPFHVFLYPLT